LLLRNRVAPQHRISIRQIGTKATNAFRAVTIALPAVAAALLGGATEKAASTGGMEHRAL
jgi:hypothetical protein